MQAIILAAGLGKRLGELARKIQMYGRGKWCTSYKWMLKQIDAKNFERIIIVTGYEGKKLVNHISNWI